MAFQQHPNGLSAHSRNQFALDNFFGQQPHRPTRPSIRRRRADHGDNLLALALVQSRSFARTRGIEQRPIQPLFLIPGPDLPHCLSRESQVGAYRGRGLSLIHLTQSQGAQYSAHRLQSAAQQLIQLLSLTLGKLNLKPFPSAHVPAIQRHMTNHKYQLWLLIHAVMVLVSLLFFASVFPLRQVGLQHSKDGKIQTESYRSAWDRGGSKVDRASAESRLLLNSLLTAVDTATFQKNTDYIPAYPAGRAIAIVETMLTSTLAALFLLAIRRQFRR